KMSVEATLKDNENRWEASYAAHDSSVAQSLVASDFNGVYWDGRVMGKAGVISEIKKDKDTYKSAVNEKLAVHSYGPGVAVVVGTARFVRQKLAAWHRGPMTRLSIRFGTRTRSSTSCTLKLSATATATEWATSAA